MEVEQHPFPGAGNAVGRERGIPAETRLDPVHALAEPGILAVGIGEKPREHPVMVALQHDPRLTPADTGQKEVDHAATVRPTVHKVADVDDRRPVIAHPPPVHRNPVVHIFQLVACAVDVAYGVGSHSRSLPVRGGRYPARRFAATGGQALLLTRCRRPAA